MLEKYDYIFAGCGVAAILLLDELLTSPLENSHILLLDLRDPFSDSKSLCFWEDKKVEDKLSIKSFDKINFTNKLFTKTFDLSSYRYKYLNESSLKQHLQSLLKKYPNIVFTKQKVVDISQTASEVTVHTQKNIYKANFVFDSRFNISKFNPGKYIFLKQHFRGWYIKTNEKTFHPEVMQMFDFRIPQGEDFRFIYSLPLSQDELLVELVTLKQTNYDELIKNYITNTLKLKDFKVISYEGGINPLTTFPFRQNLQSRILPIGIAGGLIKPSSGYAFTRMKVDAENIIKSLVKGNSLFYPPKKSKFYYFCDFLLLKLLSEKPHLGKKVFCAMFRNNGIELIFRFLDEKATNVEKLRLMLTMYPWLFIKLSIKTLLRS